MIQDTVPVCVEVFFFFFLIVFILYNVLVMVLFESFNFYFMKIIYKKFTVKQINE